MLIPSCLVEGVQLTAAVATYFTAKTKAKAILGAVSLTNTSAADKSVTIYVVKSGGAADDSQTVLKDVTVTAGKTRACPEFAGRVLESGDTLQAVASAAGSVTLMVSGLEWML